MDRFFLVMAALLGGILISLAGLWDAHEPWNSRKFGATVIRALFAAAIWAIGYPLNHAVGSLELLAAFTSAITVDVGVNRVAGALGNPQFPLPKPKAPAPLGPLTQDTPSPPEVANQDTK